MKPVGCTLCVLLLGLLMASCGEVAATATPMPTRTPRPTSTRAPAPTPSACSPANGTGTTPPHVALFSITFLVNGLEQIVRPGDSLSASSGDVVLIPKVAACADPFVGGGGDVCVELAPLDSNRQALAGHGLGTHMMPITSGVIAIPGPRDRWIVGEDWRQISVVVNHWPLGGSSDPNCGEGRCEHDDQVLIPLAP
jgi:hypothetical protein